jgi:hypothetical protein
VLNYEVYRALKKDRDVRVTLHHIDELDAAADSFGVHEPRKVPHTIFKRCAGTRLKLPFLLARLGLEKAIYVDWDTVVLCDLSLLWAEFAKFDVRGGAALAFAQTDPSGVSNLDHYREWNQPRHPTAGSINSGVMLVHVGQLMQRPARDDYWRVIEETLFSRVNITSAMDDVAQYWAFTKAFPLGDQDVLNHLFLRLPHLLHVLQPEWNFCLDWPYTDDLDSDQFSDLPPERRAAVEQRRMPCVLHFCAQKLLPIDVGRAALPCSNPWRAAHMWVKNWPLEKRLPAPDADVKYNGRLPPDPDEGCGKK